MQQYNFWHSLFKGIIKGSIFALPLVIAMFPKVWMDMTFGTALYMFVDYLQKKFTNY